MKPVALTLSLAAVLMTTGATAGGLTASEVARRAKGASFELLDAEADLTRGRLDALAARIDARVARVRLHYAVGDEPR